MKTQLPVAKECIYFHERNASHTTPMVQHTILSFRPLLELIISGFSDEFQDGFSRSKYLLSIVKTTNEDVTARVTSCSIITSLHTTCITYSRFTLLT